ASPHRLLKPDPDVITFVGMIHSSGPCFVERFALPSSSIKVFPKHFSNIAMRLS
ncbi:hypothetical protein A2U01_0103194, partial [Trifolium medium]|nr:hypothetical protein [Trifolium medium]